MMQVLWRIPIHTSWTPDGIPIYGFGMMLFAAFLMCTWVASRRATKAGVSPDIVQDLAIYIFIGGLLGARILSLLQQNREWTFWEFIKELPRIWEGGIILYGSVLGALAAYSIAYFRFIRKEGVPTLKLADIIAPTIAIGLFFGRLGCFLNGCCYGQVVCEECVAYPVTFPLSAPARFALVRSGAQTATGFTLQTGAEKGVIVDKVDPTSRAYAAGIRSGAVITKVNGTPIETQSDFSRILSEANWPRGQKELTVELLVDGEALTFGPRTLELHPAQLYEVISMALLLLVLFAFDPLKTRDGQLISIMMIGYGIHRYLNELLRDDPRPEGIEKYGSLLLIAGGLFILGWVSRKPAQYELRWA